LKLSVQGERWIADTKIRGFGLRLWSTKSGGQKAFALRVSDQASRKMRRTFDPNKTWQIAFPSEDYKYGLGDFLDEARKRAQDEIDKIKGRRTQDEIEWAERLSVGRLIRSMTLERAANALLRGLYANGAAERYRDRLDKLFARYVPEQIKTTPLATLNPNK
jgi:hypothetical protein